MSVKSSVLEILENRRGESVSGNEIAEVLGVSRNAVWKSIKQLRDEGYSILAGTNKGYCLEQGNDILSAEGIKPYLKTKAFGRRIEVFKTIDSTNNYGKVLAGQKAEHGTLVLSDMQTGGRGRLSRPFYSPAGAGIYMSLLLRPKLPLEQSVMITSCAAVAVAQAVERITGAETKIKWVNDVFTGGKKLCGILTEAGMDFESGTLDYAVVGMGINVTNKAFPEELKDVATSIEMECQKDFSRNQLIAEVLNVFEPYYEQLSEKKFLDEYIRRSNILGKEVTVYEGTSFYPATAVAIDEAARLIIRTPDGTEKALNSGEVSVRSLRY